MKETGTTVCVCEWVKMKSRKEKSKEFQILAIGDFHFLSFGYRIGLHTEIEILI